MPFQPAGPKWVPYTPVGGSILQGSTGTRSGRYWLDNGIVHVVIGYLFNGSAMSFSNSSSGGGEVARAPLPFTTKNHLSPLNISRCGLAMHRELFSFDVIITSNSALCDLYWDSGGALTRVYDTSPTTPGAGQRLVIELTYERA